MSVICQTNQVWLDSLQPSQTLPVEEHRLKEKMDINEQEDVTEEKWSVVKKEEEEMTISKEEDVEEAICSSLAGE